MNSCKVEEMFEKGGLMLVDKTCFIAALKMIYMMNSFAKISKKSISE